MDYKSSGGSDLNCLLGGLDAVVDEACRLSHSVDMQSLPAQVQQALALVDAASHIIDNLMDSFGIHDPDHPEHLAQMSGALSKIMSLSAKGSKKTAPYGNVKYADPGYRNGKKRYPLDTEERVRAALGYFAKKYNRKFYTPAQIARIQAAINSAAKGFGIELASHSG